MHQEVEIKVCFIDCHITDTTIGLDAAPIIVPVRAFGDENHRTLSSLPHQPIIRSSIQKRLIVSWWNREISLWKILKSQARDMEQDQSSEAHGREGRKLVAKIALQVSLGLRLVDDVFDDLSG